MSLEETVQNHTGVSIYSNKSEDAQQAFTTKPQPCFTTVGDGNPDSDGVCLCATLQDALRRSEEICVCLAEVSLQSDRTSKADLFQLFLGSSQDFAELLPPDRSISNGLDYLSIDNRGSEQKRRQRREHEGNDSMRNIRHDCVEW